MRGDGPGATALVEGSVIGRVRIERVLGRGGMGTVYLGHQPGLDRLVAVKVVRESLADDPEFRARFQREARLTASLDHPHIVPVYDAGEDDGRLYVVMPYLDGLDLAASLRHKGPTPPRVAARIVDQVAGALDTAHSRGLVHRDVKPANIMLVGHGSSTRAYLMDFGLTKTLAAHESITEPGTVLGTTDYMAPEQYAGTAVDGRADVYALGCVLYQALTGAVPFPRDSDVSRMYAHLREPAPRPSQLRDELPAGFDAVVGRAMAKRPEDRFPRAGDLGAAASQAAQEAQAPPPSDDDTVVSADSRPRSPWSDPSHPSHPSAPAGPSGADHTNPYTPGPRSPVDSDPSWRRAEGPHDARSRSGEADGEGPDRSTTTGSGTPGSRRWWLAGAALAVVALVTAGSVLFWPTGNPAGEPQGSTIAVGLEPTMMLEKAGAVWVPNSGDGTVTRIDVATGATSRETVGGEPYKVAVEGGALWAWNVAGLLTRHDLVTKANVQVPLPPGDILDLESGGGYVWVTGAAPGAILRINAATNAVDTFPVAGAPQYMVPGEGVLYVATATPPSVVSVDIDTGQVLGSPLRLGGETVGDLELDRGTLYAVTGGPPGSNGETAFSSTIPIDENTFVTAPPIPFGRATYVTFGADSYWAADPFANELRRYSLGDREPIGEPIRGVVKGVTWMQPVGDQIWILNADARTVTRIDIGG